MCISIFLFLNGMKGDIVRTYQAGSLDSYFMAAHSSQLAIESLRATKPGGSWVSNPCGAP